MLVVLFIASGMTAGAAAAPDSSRSLVVGEYTVRSNGVPTASNIESGRMVSVSAPAFIRGLTAEQAGKITIIAESDSFRLPAGSASVETVGQEGKSLQVKVKFEDVTYRGRGNSIRFKLTYQNGGSDEGSVDIDECVEAKRGRKDRDDEGSSKKSTLYGAPPLVVSCEPLPELIRPGQEFTLKVGVRNLSPRLSAFNLVAGFEPSDGVALLDASSSRYVQSLHSMKEKYFTVRMRANQEISTPAQSLNVSIKYEYIENSERASATAAERINLPFDPKLTGTGDVATPNVIISKFDYGEQIAVGETFDLALSLKNTNPAVAIENLIMTLEPGEGFHFVNSSNTFYYPGMGAGGTIDQSVQIKSRAPFDQSKPDYKIECSFKYEYVAGGKRTQVTSSERLSIPVYYPDRFEISPPNISEEPVEGAETTISLPYVNKGKAAISNVETELIGDIDALETRQNLGNFEAGKSGTIDFVVRPKMAGENELKIKVTYEDSNMKLKTIEYPVKLQVGELQPADAPMDDLPAEEEGFSPRMMAIPAGGLFLLAAGVLFVKKRRRAKRQTALGEFSAVWDQPEEENREDGHEQE